MKTIRHFILSLLTLCIVSGIFGFLAATALAEEYPEDKYRPHDDEVIATPEKEEANEGHSILHQIVMYIPNRVLDVFDIFRVRVRVGPGIAVGARATEIVSTELGFYDSLYLGLPGPRQDDTVKLPFGVEAFHGASISVLDASADFGMDPEYSDTEFGLDAQIGVAGFAIGIDPIEILDLFAGLFFYQVREDDL
jgi:hypothetical protein